MRTLAEQSLRDFWKTKKQILDAEMRAGDWQCADFNPQKYAPHAAVCYVLDLPTGWTWLGIVQRSDFASISAYASATPELGDAFRERLTQFIGCCADGLKPETLAPFDWPDSLGLLMISYAGSTKACQEADYLCEQGQFVVLNYRPDVGVRTPGNLRSFVIPDSESGGEVMPVSRFYRYADQVVMRDLVCHPEWFGRPSLT